MEAAAKRAWAEGLSLSLRFSLILSLSLIFSRTRCETFLEFDRPFEGNGSSCILDLVHFGGLVFC